MSEILSNVQKLELYSQSYASTLSLRISSFENLTELVKFVKSCEKLVRLSPEYKLWKDYITDVLHDNYCFITLESQEQVSVEVHHHIPSLFTLVKSVVNRKLDKNESFCSFDIALESMEIHFQNKVGYVPLVKTMHEKFHSGFLQIPTNLVKGNYKLFLSEYGNYFEDEDWDTVNQRLNVDNQENSWSKDNYPGLKQYVPIVKEN